MDITIQNVTVSFPGILALDNVNMRFEPGRVHAVLGANGSGKSTLVKVLTGIYQPRQGASIAIGGQNFTEIKTPFAAKKLGIRVVHQETPLIDSMSVAECIALFKGYPRNLLGKIQWGKLYKYSEDLLAILDIDVDPRDTAGSLSASERAMVAMSIAIGAEEEIAQTRLLILDEADAAIPEDEAAVFLTRIRHAADLGIPVIMVTHRLKEVYSSCDDITILNAGKVVYSGKAQDTKEDYIVRCMLQVEDNQKETVPARDIWEGVSRTSENKTAVLEVLHLKNDTLLRDVSFSVGKGEIVGIVGIANSGITQLPMILAGDENRTGGEIKVGGRPLAQKLTPTRAIEAGIALVPADRSRQGGAMGLTLRDNLLMPRESRYFLKNRLASQTVENAMQIFDVRPQMPMMTFGKFSGGNQQKAIIAKWLLTRPNIMVLDDPTYGVDPVSRIKIFDSLMDAGKSGVGILVFSTEPEQLALLCSRVLVLQDGTIVQQLRTEDHTLSRESIARWCYA